MTLRAEMSIHLKVMDVCNIPSFWIKCFAVCAVDRKSISFLRLFQGLAQKTTIDVLWLDQHAVLDKIFVAQLVRLGRNSHWRGWTSLSSLGCLSSGTEAEGE